VLKRLISGGLTVAALSCVRAIAADGIIPLPVKASAAPYYDWTGFYVGGHLGYATGYSKWAATEAGADVPSLAGSLDFFRAFDGFKGTGSYYIGLQAGYNYMFPSRLVLGVEADVSVPSVKK